MEQHRFNMSDLKQALSRNIKVLHDKYKYTGISAYDFDAIVNKSLNYVNQMYSVNNGESVDSLFRKSINLYMGKYIREEIIYDNKIVSSYVNNNEIDINDITSCTNCLNEISKIYEISCYAPSYVMINSLLNTASSKKLNEILSNSLIIWDKYAMLPDSIKTMVEVYSDKNDIDLISIIMNDKSIEFDRIKKLSDKVASGDNKYLFELISLKRSIVDGLSKLFNEIDKKQIENLFNEAVQNYSDKPKGGLLLNNIRKETRKNIKTYEFEEFINRYNKCLEFASIDDFILPLSVQKKGIYRYLKDNSSDVIDKVINELPSKYLIILHNSYGKSLRYINYNSNLGIASQKKLSIVLITIRDYIRYKNNQINIIPERVNNYKINNLNFDEAFQNVKDTGYDGVFSKLNELERIVVMLKFGLVNDREYSNEEIANFFNIDEKEIISILIKYLNLYKEEVISIIDNTLNEYKKIK